MNTRNLTRWVVHPLLPLLLTASLAVAARPVVMTERATADGVTVEATLDATRMMAGEVLLTAAITNRTDRELALPAHGEKGLRFQIVEPSGRVFLDAGSPIGIMAVEPLAPGETARVSLDLGTRSLVEVRGCPWEEVGTVRGLTDPAFADVAHVDIHVHWSAGDVAVDLEPLRLVMNVFLFEATERFHRLHAEPVAEVAVWDPVHPIERSPSYVPGSVLVRFADDVDEKTAADRIEEVGYEVAGAVAWELTRTVNVAVPAGSEPEAVRFLRTVPGVEAATLNHVAWVM